MHLATFKLKEIMSVRSSLFPSLVRAQRVSRFSRFQAWGRKGYLLSFVQLGKKEGTGMNTGECDMNRGLLMDLRTFRIREIQCRSAGEEEVRLSPSMCKSFGTDATWSCSVKILLKHN